MPGVKRGPKRGSRVSGDRLHKHIVKALFQRTNQQRIECEAACKGDVLCFTQHGGHGLFDYELQTACQIRFLFSGERRLGIDADCFEEMAAESALAQAVGIEVAALEFRPAVARIHNGPKYVSVNRLAAN